jgi:hypothetical protein
LSAILESNIREVGIIAIESNMAEEILPKYSNKAYHEMSKLI